MMMMMSPPPTQSTKNNPATTPKGGAKKAKSAVKKGLAVKRFTPKHYPKPTLAELALLVGVKPKNPDFITVIEKPLPYELNWRENGAELSLYAANQQFIALQMTRLQTHVVKPLLTTLPIQAIEIQPKISVTEVDSSIEIKVALNNQPESLAKLKALKQPPLTSTASNNLSLLLGLQETEEIENEEDPCPTCLDLEFETPIETKIADYLGVKYASRTTISVADSGSSINTLNRQRLPQDKALLPIEDYFWNALEAELAQQKAWLATALEREKYKAYPKTSAYHLPKKPADDFSVETNDDENGTQKTAEEALLPNNNITEVNGTLEDAESEVIIPPSDNNPDFAAVLDSLMEDFSNEALVSSEETTLAEPEEDVNIATKAEETQAADSFEVIGLYAENTMPEEEMLPETITSSLGIQAPTAHNPFEEMTTFHQLLKVTKPDTPLDFLLLGSYFLKQQEQKETFSLRQLNHLLSSVSKPNANHTVLELALAKHFITIVPDLTGTATATEYQLSKTGEASALRLYKAVSR